ncbi:MAG: DUF308 domain-containing protein [Bacteroidales bacterium]|nr:DUF308 domain-containing protein [Bacteroidales bacterium]
MEYFVERLASGASKTVKNWWMLLIAGLLLIIGGIVVFVNPVESYITLSMMFGIMMLITGLAELIIAITSHNFFAIRSYTIVGGIIDMIIGILLCCNIGVTAIILPIILGVYLLYHSFMIIGFGSDLEAFNVKGYGWPLAGGVILLILSILILINPFSFGTSAVVILTGIALIIMGGIFIVKSLRMRNLHSFFKSLDR